MTMHGFTVAPVSPLDVLMTYDATYFCLDAYAWGDAYGQIVILATLGLTVSDQKAPDTSL